MQFIKVYPQLLTAFAHIGLQKRKKCLASLAKTTIQKHTYNYTVIKN